MDQSPPLSTTDNPRSASSRASIGELDKVVARLPAQKRGLFNRIFQVIVSHGQLSLPEAMNDWIERDFGSLEAVRKQKIIRVTNLFTHEGSVFNPLRSSRPLKVKKVDLDAEIERDMGDSLCTPLTQTPEDTFGRIRGSYCVSGSNIAKYEGFHAILVFGEHHPLRFTRERIADYFDTGLRWAEKAHEMDASAKYYFFIWNCLWRAGASLLHGHAQMILGREAHYAKVEALRQTGISYKARYQANYFDDLYQAHRLVGCGFEKEGTRVLAHLAPVKEKEIVLMSQSLDSSLKERVYEVLACLRDRMEVASFNLALYMPPIAGAKEGWEGFPVIVRIVDRGRAGDRSSDIGAMELYACSVIASDPFEVAAVVKDYLGDR